VSKQPKRKAHLQAEHFTHRALWTGAQVLRVLGKTSEAGQYASVASALFVYLAFEGFLNDLGETIAPTEWGRERAIFTKPSFKGTLGKLAFLAERCGAGLEKGRRPYSTLKALDTRRSRLVHPRTERLAKTVTFGDPRDIPDRLESQAMSFATDRFLKHAFADTEAVADQLVSAARARFSREMRTYIGRAFFGEVATQSGRIA
jgi:hypothetical protein